MITRTPRHHVFRFSMMALLAVVGLTIVGLSFSACQKAGAPPSVEKVDADPGPASDPQGKQPPWDLAAAEILSWRVAEEHFSQAHAVEASGLAAHDGALFVALEKYAVVLRVDTSHDLKAQVLRIDVPPKTELEGVSFANGKLYLCDEAQAAVYEVSLAAIEGDHSTPGLLPAQRLPIEGVELPAGKIGLEGIAVEPDGSHLYLTLERGQDSDGGCAALLYRFMRDGETLRIDGEPLPIQLESCEWRLTDLALWQGQLLSLRTRFPSKRYQLITIDPTSGELEVLADLTDLMAMLHRTGYGDNLEGITVGGDGSLYLVCDNAVTDVITNPVPPPAAEPTLLLRIPRREPTKS